MGAAHIRMYVTGWCPYCTRARSLLSGKGVAVEEIDIEAVAGAREEMLRRSGRSSVPQIFIGDEHIGGSDELYALEAQGRLDPKLSNGAQSMMNEPAGAAPGAEMPADSSVVLALQSVYLKDCSYESPNGPRVDGNWNPQINLDLQTSSTALGPEAREVVLTVTVSAKIGEVTVFLVEVKQAGLFVIRNLSDDELKRCTSTVCPGVLFPYARAAVSQLVSQGGFPQFLLPPVNFEALYAANLQAPPAVTN
jgi:preprotein translocase subunit SecB